MVITQIGSSRDYEVVEAVGGVRNRVKTRRGRDYDDMYDVGEGQRDIVRFRRVERSVVLSMTIK